jgi:hypothetical protein
VIGEQGTGATPGALAVAGNRSPAPARPALVSDGPGPPPLQDLGPIGLKLAVVWPASHRPQDRSCVLHGRGTSASTLNAQRYATEYATGSVIKPQG